MKLQRQYFLDDHLEPGPHLLAAGNDLVWRQHKPVAAGVAQLGGEGEPRAQHALIPVVTGPGSGIYSYSVSRAALPCRCLQRSAELMGSKTVPWTW